MIRDLAIHILRVVLRGHADRGMPLDRGQARPGSQDNTDVTMYDVIGRIFRQPHEGNCVFSQRKAWWTLWTTN